MEIKATDVAKLRKMTGAGMMDCKKALVEANGDFERAKEIIREKGKLVAAKRSDRETTEGAVIAITNSDHTKAVLVCLGCETDFVAKNSEFKALADDIAATALANMPADLDALKACKLSDGNTVEEGITLQTGKSGEKHAVPFYGKIEAPYIGSYIHMNNKVATIVGFSKPIDEHAGKEIAMQITAMNPVSITKDDCPKSVVEKELEIAIEKTKEEQVQKAVEAALKKAGFNLYIAENEEHINEGIMKGNITEAQAQEIRDLKAKVSAEKAANLPEQMIQNIAQGRLAKFFKESTLEEQIFVKDGKISVKEYLKGIDPEVKVVAFKRFSLND
jgi:translation elongation factor Ts